MAGISVMRIVLSTWGKFHSFHLARQMERFDWLQAIFTTYPRFHLRKEKIAREKILANPWFHFPLIAKWRLGFENPAIDRMWSRLVDRSQQKFIAKNLPPCDAFIALSGSGLAGGRLAQERGAKWICDRSSSHIEFTDDLLSEEYAAFGVAYRRADPWAVAKELCEYREADAIVVPSEFARRSFIAKGVDETRLVKIQMGSDLQRFRKVAEPNPDEFVVCYCGRISFAKGIPYLLDAFRRLNHPRKRLTLIGAVQEEMKPFLSKANLDGVEFLGRIPNAELPKFYSRANVFVIASIEDGWGMVQTEAMACGAPVISSVNTGASDCIDEGINGFVVPIRAPEIIAERLQRLADEPVLRAEMGENARRSIEALGGWDDYGNQFRDLCLHLKG
jgi:glycosyltransferase involved in cell wall biosynthesis